MLVRMPHCEPLLSADPMDLDCPGVVIVVDPDVADQMGAFLETALSECAAWPANDDLGWL